MGYVRRTRPQGPPQAITLSQVEIGHGDHVALADVVVTTIFLKSGLEDLGRLLLIQNGELVDVGQRLAVSRTSGLALDQRVRHAEFDGRLDVPCSFLQRNPINLSGIRRVKMHEKQHKGLIKEATPNSPKRYKSQRKSELTLTKTVSSKHCSVALRPRN